MDKIAVFFLLIAATAYSLDFEPCEDEEGVPPNSFFIYKCHIQPCVFVRGKKFGGSINFTVEEDTTEIYSELQVEQHESHASFVGQGMYKCSKFAERNCSYEVGSTAKYFFRFPVMLETVEEEVIPFKMVLRNEHGNTITCVKFRGRIADRAEPTATGTPIEPDYDLP